MGVEEGAQGVRGESAVEESRSVSGAFETGGGGGTRADAETGGATRRERESEGRVIERGSETTHG